MRTASQSAQIRVSPLARRSMKNLLPQPAQRRHLLREVESAVSTRAVIAIKARLTIRIISSLCVYCCDAA